MGANDKRAATFHPHTGPAPSRLEAERDEAEHPPAPVDEARVRAIVDPWHDPTLPPSPAPF